VLKREGSAVSNKYKSKSHLVRELNLKRTRKLGDTVSEIMEMLKTYSFAGDILRINSGEAYLKQSQAL